MKYEIIGFNHWKDYNSIDDNDGIEVVQEIYQNIELIGISKGHKPLFIYIKFEFPQYRSSFGVTVDVYAVEEGYSSLRDDVMKYDDFLSFKKNERFVIDTDKLNNIEIHNRYLNLSVKDKEVEVLKYR